MDALPLWGGRGGRYHSIEQFVFSGLVNPRGVEYINGPENRLRYLLCLLSYDHLSFFLLSCDQYYLSEHSLSMTGIQRLYHFPS